MLFAIAEGSSIGYDAHTEQPVAVGCLETEVNGSVSSRFHSKLPAHGGDDLLRCRVEKGASCRALHRAVAQVGNRGGNLRLIAHTDKARHVGRKHKLLRRNCRCLKHARQHLLGMGIATEVPAGQALGHGEGDSYLALLVGAKLRIEESGFGEVGAQIGKGLQGLPLRANLFFKQLSTGIGFFFHIDRHVLDFYRFACSCNGFGCRTLDMHSGRICQPAGSTITRHFRRSRNSLILCNEQLHCRHSLIRKTEIVEAPCRYPPALQREIEVEPSIAVTGHIATGSIQAARIEQPQQLVVRIELIQRSIVHRGKQFGSCGSSLRSLDGEFPLLRLSGAQAVAEHLPLHVQGSLGLTFLQKDVLGIHPVVLHKVENQCHAFAVLLLIGILHADNGVAPLQHAAFDALLIAKYIHQHVSILVGGS